MKEDRDQDEKVKISVFIATSLDGFIARKNGEIDWLMDADNSGGEEDYGYKEFFGSVDCLVMGRNTMEKVLSFGEWPYEEKRVVILSRALTELPQQIKERAELYSGPVADLIKKLEQEACHSLYIDGGKTIQSFLKCSLINEIILTRIPILLGEGIPLFGKLQKDLHLKHIHTKEFQSGFVQSTYEVVLQ
ncbi:MAG: dihydrofolate reductase family protein [Gammaproteobacteria bacterium]|nr:dihydrofolate reductase family protein [Gammaproteobacteria bacterium]MDH5692713.1 dihydrofolate reductase family protein [Gammaproteobacteria bacterium]